MIILTFYKGNMEIFPVESFEYFINNIFDDYDMSDKIYVIKSNSTYELDVKIYFEYMSNLKNLEIFRSEPSLFNHSVNTLSKFTAYYAKIVPDFDRIEYLYDDVVKQMQCVRYATITVQNNNKISAKYMYRDELINHNVKCNNNSCTTELDISFYRLDLLDTYDKIQNTDKKNKKRKRI